ncbi:MAG: hypothetical protein IPI67_41645 [Myxococcales bacterium]|nr:hypothetical protein [Myxococcales bacterium]
MFRRTLGVIAVSVLAACGGDDSSSSSGGGVSSASGGSGGSSASGGSGGSSASGGSGGSSASGGSGGGAAGTGGASGAGGNSGGAAGTGGAGGNTGGAAGTGGSAGGTGGSTGGSGGSGGSTGGSGGSGGSGGQACTWGTTQCPSGEYCEAPGCGAGKCVKIPSETDGKTPVCGCDGVTYWNTSVAAHASMSVKGSGACSTGGKTCGGFVGTQCPTNTYCNYAVSSSSMCNVSDASGTCWGLPANCPTILIGPSTRACKATSCKPECDLIKSGAVWYADNTCPV